MIADWRGFVEGLKVAKLLKKISGPSKRILVEFSSPNIAKPFHVGHLRSTLLGNFFANLFTKAGHQVTKINYLGDWGTQFGLLSMGMEKFGNSSELHTDKGLRHLFEVYVKSNEQVKLDPTFYTEALRRFTLMENGDTEAVEFWTACKNVSLREFNQLYDLLGVSFDVIQGESMYWRPAQKLLDDWKAAGVVQSDQCGRLGIATSGIDTLPPFIPLAKSDGSTLYLTRDLAAILDRNERFSFDSAYYVVDNGQHHHFLCMKACLKAIGRSDLADKLTHVKFGRVEGMSTRSGNVIFVEELIKEGQTRAVKMLQNTFTTKTDRADWDEVGKQLAVSSLIISDFQERRTHDVKFSWDRSLQIRGDCGPYIHWVYAKMCSLERNSTVPQQDYGESLRFCTDSDSEKLLNCMSRLESALEQTYTQLEPHHLVKFLFKLARQTSSAAKQLRVNDEPNVEVAKERLQLLTAAKNVLGDGMSLLGLPLMEKL